MVYIVKIFDIIGLRQRDILTQRFFWKELARQNLGLQSGHEFGTLPIVFGPGSIQFFLTKGNAMGERRVFSKDPPLPTFSFTRRFQYYE